jgi:hypothetical protein
MVGAFALARSIPAIKDLLPPLGLGISEFLIFAVFIHSFKPRTAISTVLPTWFAAMLLFGLCAFLVIIRARSLYRSSRASYGDDVLPVLDSYIDCMTLSANGPAVLMIISAIGFSTWLAFHEKVVAIVCAALIILDFAFGLWFHDVEAKPWQSLLAGDEESEPPRMIKWSLKHIRERRLGDTGSLSGMPDDHARPSSTT